MMRDLQALLVIVEDRNLDSSGHIDSHLLVGIVGCDQGRDCSVKRVIGRRWPL